MIALYRNWLLTITEDAATGEKFDNSQERFECHRQASAEAALRMAKGKVDWNEGPEVWDPSYENEALK